MDTVKGLVNPLGSPTADESNLSDPETTNAFNQANLERAAKQEQEPIMGVFKSVREAIARLTEGILFIPSIPVNLVDKAYNLTARVGARAGLAAVDVIGYPAKKVSSILKTTRQKISSTIGGKNFTSTMA